MPDNNVIRERYNGLVEVNGQLVLLRGDVAPEEVVATQPDDEGAHNNGAGVERVRRRRRTVEEE